MNNEITTIEKPIPCGCPICWTIITKAHMEGEYIVYRCKICGWKTPRTDFYKIG